MKEEELRKMAICGICEKKFGHTNLPLFWRLTIERFALDMRTIEQQDDLAMMLGSSVLASVMGPDKTMAKSVMKPVKITICEDCIMKPTIIAMLAERESEAA